MNIVCSICGLEQPESEKCIGCGHTFTGSEVKIRVRDEVREIPPQHGQGKDRSVPGIVLFLAIFVLAGIAIFYALPGTADRSPDTQATKSAQKNEPANLRHISGEHRVACLSEGDLDKAVSFAVQRDAAAFAKMMYQGRCFLLMEGEPVYLLDFRLSGKAKIRRQGDTESAWTIFEAVKNSTK